MSTPKLDLLLRQLLLFLGVLQLSSCRLWESKLSLQDLTQILPYHYSAEVVKQAPEDALKADILLLGGNEAQMLGQSLASFYQDSGGPHFYALTDASLNLARIVQLFSNNHFQAKWIIYLPSQDDELVQLFEPNESPQLLENLQTLQSWWWKYLFHFFPSVALSTLKRLTPQSIDQEPVSITRQLSDAQKIQRALASTALFRFLLQNWVTHLPQTRFLLVSTPIDFQQKPSNCSLGLHWSWRSVLNQQLTQIEQKDWQAALETNDQLRQAAPFNASTYYLRAKIQSQQQDFESAFRHLTLAWMLNCRSPYTALKNSILEVTKTIHAKQVAYFNLNKWVAKNCFGTEIECFDDQQLKAEHYQNAAEALKIFLDH